MKTLNTQLNQVCKRKVRLNGSMDIYISSRYDKIIGDVRIRSFKGYLRYMSMFSNQSWPLNIKMPLVLKRGKR